MVTEEGTSEWGGPAQAPPPPGTPLLPLPHGMGVGVVTRCSHPAPPVLLRCSPPSARY